MIPEHRRIERANRVAADLYGPVAQHVALSTPEDLRAVAAAFGVPVVPTADHRLGCAVLTGGRAVTFDAPDQSRPPVAVPDGLEDYREAAAS